MEHFINDEQENVAMNFKDSWERMGSRTGVSAEVDWRSQLTEEQIRNLEESLSEDPEVDRAREAAVDWATHPYRDEKQAVDGLLQALSELPGLWIELEENCVDGPDALLNEGDHIIFRFEVDNLDALRLVGRLLEADAWDTPCCPDDHWTVRLRDSLPNFELVSNYGAPEAHEAARRLHAVIDAYKINGRGGLDDMIEEAVSRWRSRNGLSR